MTASDPIDQTAGPAESGPDRGSGAARFLGEAAFLGRLLLRGGLLLVLTLGLYRFWLVTDIRRFLWGHTEIAGDGLEYLGTARELLIGFLLAIALLLPIYMVFLAATFDFPLIGRLAGLLGFAMLALLGHFAVFRARRYRLTRTLFRGLRFNQTGSAWRYAACALAWWISIILTLGLAYPWAQASLERYKLRNTFYGDLAGRFEGSGTRLFFRGVLLWALVVAPLVLALAVTIRATDFGRLAEALARGGDEALAQIEGANPQFVDLVLYLALASCWSLVAAAALYPAFQAMVLRWWVSGLRFGEIATTSRLRTSNLYAIYGRFLWHAVVLSIGVIVVVLIMSLSMRALGHLFAGPGLQDLLSTAVFVGIYVITALAYSIIYQLTVKLGLWRLGFDSLDISGLGALDRVRAQGGPSSAIGEGLVDALHVGGY